MSDTTFTNNVTLSEADWFNDLNRLHYTIFGDAATARAALDALYIKGSDVVCAATLDLSLTTGDFVHVTGSTGPITAITLASGKRRFVVFDSTPTITHNATTLILPGAANIVAAAGDIALFSGDGSGNVRCLSYVVAANPFGPPYTDTNAIVKGSSDATKKIRFEVDGLTTATTRVITVPDMDVSLGNGPNIPVKVFTASGTDTVPAWAHRAKVYVKAAGGGGGSSTTTKGGGGGEGEERTGWFSVTPGATVTVTLNNGGGGAGSNANASGSNGGTSVATDGTFTITAQPGSGGTSGNSGGAGGPGGSAGTGGDYAMPGNAGQAGSDSGGGTIAIFASGGGNGGGFFATTAVANSGGGGGGGGPANAAGNGAKGIVVVEYWP